MSAPTGGDAEELDVVVGRQGSAEHYDAADPAAAAAAQERYVAAQQEQLKLTRRQNTQLRNDVRDRDAQIQQLKQKVASLERTEQQLTEELSSLRMVTEQKAREAQAAGQAATELRRAAGEKEQQLRDAARQNTELLHLLETAERKSGMLERTLLEAREAQRRSTDEIERNRDARARADELGAQLERAERHARQTESGLTRDLENARQALAERDRAMAELQARIVTMSRANEELQGTAAEAARKEAAAAKAEEVRMRGLQNQMEALRQAAREERQEREGAERRLAQTKRAEEELAAKVTALEEEAAERAAREAELTGKLEGVEQRLGATQRDLGRLQNKNMTEDERTKRLQEHARASRTESKAARVQVQELVAQLEEARGKSERLVEARRAAEERARALELRLQYLLNRSRDDERKAVTTHATTQQLEEQIKALQAELADTRKRLRAVGASNAAMAAAMRATETTLEASAAPRLPTPAARSTLPASRAGGGSRRGSNGSDDADPSRDGPTRALSRSTGALSRPQSVPAARNRQRTASTASGARGGGGGAADEAGGGGEFPDHDPALGGNPLGNSIAGLPLPHSDSEDDAEIGGRTFEPGAQRKPFKVVVQPPTRLGATVGPIVIKARDPVANTFLLRYAVNTWLRNFARGDASRQARRLKAETAQQLATLLTIAHEAEAGLRGAHADHEREVAQLQTKLLYLQRALQRESDTRRALLLRLVRCSVEKLVAQLQLQRARVPGAGGEVAQQAGGSIDLCCSGLQDEDLHAVVALMHQSEGGMEVAEIDLRGNELTDLGVEALLPVLVHSRQLRHVDLRHNAKITPNGLRAIEDALLRNPRVRWAQTDAQARRVEAYGRTELQVAPRVTVAGDTGDTPAVVVDCGHEGEETGAEPSEARLSHSLAGPPPLAMPGDGFADSGTLPAAYAGTVAASPAVSTPAGSAAAAALKLGASVMRPTSHRSTALVPGVPLRVTDVAVRGDAAAGTPTAAARQQRRQLSINPDAPVLPPPLPPTPVAPQAGTPARGEVIGPPLSGTATLGGGVPYSGQAPLSPLQRKIWMLEQQLGTSAEQAQLARDRKVLQAQAAQPLPATRSPSARAGSRAAASARGRDPLAPSPALLSPVAADVPRFDSLEDRIQRLERQLRQGPGTPARVAAPPSRR